MTEEDEEDFKSNNICRLCESIKTPMRLEIIVIYKAHREDQLLKKVM